MCTKSARGQRECTAGQRSSHRKCSPKYLGTSPAQPHTSSAGIGPSASPATVPDTPSSCKLLSSLVLYDLRPSHRVHGAVPELAAILFSFLFSFVVTFCGVFQPYRLLGWWQWMYVPRLLPRFVALMYHTALGRSTIVCSDIEYVTVNLQPARPAVSSSSNTSPMPAGTSSSQMLRLSAAFAHSPPPMSSCPRDSTSRTATVCEHIRLSYIFRIRQGAASASAPSRRASRALDRLSDDFATFIAKGLPPPVAIRDTSPTGVDIGQPKTHVVPRKWRIKYGSAKCAAPGESFVSDEVIEEVVKITELELRLQEPGAGRYDCAERQRLCSL
ncbi:pleiotropic drug resistance ABC transporter [Salix suchowensis]|nr:pleiotropic drug resistance ABC transporter [Salix suchowensis]